jgi:hypothetical protein
LIKKIIIGCVCVCVCVRVFDRNNIFAYIMYFITWKLSSPITDNNISEINVFSEHPSCQFESGRPPQSANVMWLNRETYNQINEKTITASFFSSFFLSPLKKKWKLITTMTRVERLIKIVFNLDCLHIFIVSNMFAFSFACVDETYNHWRGPVNKTKAKKIKKLCIHTIIISNRIIFSSFTFTNVLLIFIIWFTARKRFFFYRHLAAAR